MSKHEEKRREAVFRGKLASYWQPPAPLWDWETYGVFHILQQNTAGESFCLCISYWH